MKIKQSKEGMKETPFSLVVTVDVHNLTSRGRSATSLPKTQNSVLSPFSYNHLLDEDQYSLSNQCTEILHYQLYIIRETLAVHVIQNKLILKTLSVCECLIPLF